MLVQHLSEGGAPDDGKLAVPDCVDAGRPRQAVDHCQFAHNCARPQDGENTLLARGRSDANLEHAVAQPIAAVASVASLKQRLAFAQLERPLAGQQLAQDFARKLGQQLKTDLFRRGLRILQALPPGASQSKKWLACDKPTRLIFELSHGAATTSVQIGRSRWLERIHLWILVVKFSAILS